MGQLPIHTLLHNYSLLRTTSYLQKQLGDLCLPHLVEIVLFPTLWMMHLHEHGAPCSNLEISKSIQPLVFSLMCPNPSVSPHSIGTLLPYSTMFPQVLLPTHSLR
jgi:hypothetical protein